MLEGPGFFKERPDPNDPEYLEAALKQTPVELVRSDMALLKKTRQVLQAGRVRLPGPQHNPVLETTVLTYLGVDRDSLPPQMPYKSPAPQSTRLLLFAHNGDGRFYPSIGDIVGAAGHSVAVVSPDELRRQRQESANPNISYHRKSMGALTMENVSPNFGTDDVEPGFDVALLSGDHDPISYQDAMLSKDGSWVHYSSAERIRGVLRVMRPAGRIILSDTLEIQGFLRTVDSDNELAAELHSSYDMAYLCSYDDNSHYSYAISPYLILEKHT